MSPALDEDTAQTLATGRETAGAMIGTARTHLQKVFIVFVLGLVGTIYVLRTFLWEFLQSNTRSRMSEVVGSQTEIIARNPFDVILVQVKIGLFVGIFLALPLLIYYSRDALRERGFDSVVPISRPQQVALAGLGALLFAGGIVYAYAVFFPVMFSFLAKNAIQAAVKPSYDIVLYVQFLVLLTVSFGLAAELPLVMTILSYAEIVPYETFRDRWKYAVIAIFTFGAMFSPPDPFTQIMWAVPLCALYAFSLGLSKLVTNIRRAGDTDPDALTIRGAVYRVVGLFVLAGAGGYALAQGGLTAFNDRLRPALPGLVRPGPVTVEGVVGVTGPLGDALFAVVVAVVVVAVAVFLAVIRVLNDPVVPEQRTTITGDPADIDVDELAAEAVRTAPPELFLEMTEQEAADAAGRAMDAEDDPEKAQAILDRFDEVREGDAAESDADADDGDAPPTPTGTWADGRDAEGLLDRIAVGTDRVDWRRRARGLWFLPVVAAVAPVVAAYVAFATDLVSDRVPAAVPDPAALTGLAPTPAAVAVGAAVGLALAALVTAALALWIARDAASDPTAVDLSALSVEEVRTAPPAVYAAMSETAASRAADRAVRAGDHETGAAILDRFDRAQERTGEDDTADEEGDVEGGVFTDTAAGMADAFTEEETTEEDIGGYYYDIAFIVDSLTSKAFRIVGLFMAVMGVSFYWLYQGGLGVIKSTFFRQVPDRLLEQMAQRAGGLESDPSAANYIIALHPVEQLIFEVKVSAIIGAVVALPAVMYYAWPALQQRGIVSGGDRRVFGLWGGSLVGGMVGGSLVGFFYVAPNIISWLVADALRAGMVVSYRLNAFMWLVIFTTVGIGLLANIPITMVLFDLGDIVPYETMRDRWRVVVLAVFAVCGLVIPGGTITMFVLALPVCLAYGVGLALLSIPRIPRTVVELGRTGADRLR